MSEMKQLMNERERTRAYVLEIKICIPILLYINIIKNVPWFIKVEFTTETLWYTERNMELAVRTLIPNSVYPLLNVWPKKRHFISLRFSLLICWITVPSTLQMLRVLWIP